MLEIYKVSLVIGCVLCLVPLIIYIATWCWQLVWAWVDDSEADHRNLMIKWLCYRMGYTDKKSNSFPYYTPGRDLSSGAWPFFQVVLILLVIPVLSVAAFQFYPITIAVLLTFGLAYVLRFARRLSKKFKLHTSDKDAHKSVK